MLLSFVLAVDTTNDTPCAIYRQEILIIDKGISTVLYFQKYNLNARRIDTRRSVALGLSNKNSFVKSCFFFRHQGSPTVNRCESEATLIA